MRVVAIINIGAGTPHGQDVEEFSSSLAATFQDHGIEAELIFAKGDEVRRSTERALNDPGRSKFDAAVVGGGDGTVRTVAAFLAGTDMPLGVLPLGTLNHFAKDLAIPASVEGAVAVIADGHSRRIDVAEVNGLVFLNNSSIGIYPHLVVDRERRTSLKGVSKWIAMLLAILRVLRKWPVRRLWISAKGWTSIYRTPCLFVGNNPYDLSGLGKREILDSGKLWVSIAKQEGRLSFLRVAVRAIVGSVDDRDLQSMTVHSAEVRSRTSRLLVALDGEVEMMQPPLRYCSRPGALRVYAPKATPF